MRLLVGNRLAPGQMVGKTREELGQLCSSAFMDLRSLWSALAEVVEVLSDEQLAEICHRDREMKDILAQLLEEKHPERWLDVDGLLLEMKAGVNEERLDRERRQKIEDRMARKRKQHISDKLAGRRVLR